MENSFGRSPNKYERRVSLLPQLSLSKSSTRKNGTQFLFSSEGSWLEVEKEQSLEQSLDLKSSSLGVLAVSESEEEESEGSVDFSAKESQEELKEELQEVKSPASRKSFFFKKAASFRLEGIPEEVAGKSENVVESIPLRAAAPRKAQQFITRNASGRRTSTPTTQIRSNSWDTDFPSVKPKKKEAPSNSDFQALFDMMLDTNMLHDFGDDIMQEMPNKKLEAL